MSSIICSVRGCHNNWRKRREFLQQERFEHRPQLRSQCTCGAPYDLHPPPKDRDALRRWLEALNMENPPKCPIVCSFHFVDKKPIKEHPYPEKWLGYEAPQSVVHGLASVLVLRLLLQTGITPTTIYCRFPTHAHLMAFWRLIEPAAHKTVRVTRAAQTDEVSHAGNAMPGTQRLNADTTQIEGLPVGEAHQDHNYCSTTEPAALDVSLDHTEETARLQKQMEEAAISNKFGLERFAASDEDIRFYTRFPTHAHLMAFWRLIEPAAHKTVRVTRAAQTDEVSHADNAMSLPPVDEFFLFMTYLSLGLMQKDLAHRFRIHQSVNYSDTQVVLDFTELRCQRPNPLLLQSEVFSTYKGLIGIAPHGAITFVSALYAGSISDKEILKQSGIVSLLKPTMAVMVDESFPVEDCVPCKVYTPALLSMRAQPSVPKVGKMQSIARLRVHVERLIRRVKENKIFSTEIPLSVTGSINQLHTVACLLVN